MTQTWKHNGLTGQAVYEILCRQTQGIQFKDSKNNQQFLAVQKWKHADADVGLWKIASNPTSKTCKLTLTRDLPAKDSLTISFQEGTLAEVTIAIPSLGGEVRSFSNVREIRIVPNQSISVTDPDGPTTETPDADDVGFEEEKRALEEKLRKATEERDAASAQAEALKAAAEAGEVTLRDLETARAENGLLERIAAANVDGLLLELSSGLASLCSELKKKLGELESVKGELDRTQASILDAEKKKAELGKALEEAKKLEEIRTMDCEDAERKLAALRAQFGDDQATLILMQEEPFLKGQSVSKKLENVEKELDAAEKTIGQILRWREAIDERIQRVVLQGTDGTIPLAEELGGNKDGVGSGPEEKDP